MISDLLLDPGTLPAEGSHLVGFAWADTDFVIGTDGLSAYEAAGDTFHWGADGYHVLIRRSGDRIRIGADAAGYAHLFYWSDGADWAVAYSFIQLVAYLRRRGVRLTENIAQTGAFLSRKQLFQQLTTTETAVREVRVLRVDERLEIGPEGLRVVEMPEPAKLDYATALHAFVETWLGRIATLRAEPHLTLLFHLSGGIDSRVVTAFHIWLNRHGPASVAATGVRSLTNKSHEDDFEIARKVAEAGGVNLNTPGPSAPRTLSVDQALASWRATSAGAYSPVRTPVSVSPPSEIHFSGHASNGLKWIVDAQAARRRVRTMRRSYGFFGRGDRSRWQAAFEAELDRLTVRAGGDIGRGWRRFLRTGRARFHGGQAASYKTQVAILDSRLAWQAAEARPDVGSDFQFCHDVLHALAPDLLEVPFDSAAKALSADARDHLTTLGPLSPGPGKVFGTFPEHTTTDATETTRGAAVRDLLAEIDKGWHKLPPGRLNLFWNWHYWRIRRRLARDQVPHPVALRHLHPAWLLIRLKELGVELAQ